jgi:hypothetical protein
MLAAQVDPSMQACFDAVAPLSPHTMNAPGTTQPIPAVDILEEIPLASFARERRDRSANAARSLLVIAAFSLAASCVLGGAVLVAARRPRPQAAAMLQAPRAQEASPRVLEPPREDVPLVSVEDLPRVSPQAKLEGAGVASAAAQERCVLRTPGAPPDRRVFVDGRVAGTTSAPVMAPCGSHVVQVGSAGMPRRIELPCGGEIDVR